MTLEHQVIFWAALLVALLFLLHLLGSTVTPFVAGIALGWRCQSNDNSFASKVARPIPSFDYAASPFHSANAAVRLCL